MTGSSIQLYFLSLERFSLTGSCFEDPGFQDSNILQLLDLPSFMISMTLSAKIVYYSLFHRLGFFVCDLVSTPMLAIMYP